ncbi:unnamed protein product [Parnassius apollo]|uniref:(apollo) hypothetical protein n=1 Tax=Parnassius apollo TaxID=110799 RepID=A0A8S3W3M3_PARAO|nr:unnamed protein product [Parnassius apollo]
MKYDKQSILDCNKNIKKLWDKINSLLGNERKSLDDLILSNMRNQGSVKEICDKFADNFLSEVDLIRHTCTEKWLVRDNYVDRPDVCMRWQPVCSGEVKRVINQLDKNKSPGTDLVRMSDLKLVVDKISPVIANIVNLSVKHHRYPNKLKEAIIRPVHKKGDRKFFSNYRPIAILSSIDKIMDECGVGQPLNQWFRDYLASRIFRVKVGDTFSEATEVRCGVPQGSGCGPICYLLYVNSLCDVLQHSSAYMFADDLCTLRAGTNLMETCHHYSKT